MSEFQTDWFHKSVSLVGDREEQQDAYAVFTCGFGDFFVIADGLGGHSGGQQASQAAIRAIGDFLLSEGFTDECILDLLGEAANDAVRKVRENARFADAASTLAVLHVSGSKGTFATIGDTRIHRLEAGGDLKVSRDDTVAQLLVERGDILPAELRGHQDRNRLTRSLGSSRFKGFEYQRFDLLGVYGFLLASDGFWDRTPELEIARLIESENADLHTACSNAVSSASPDADNATVMLVRRLKESKD